MSDDILTTTHFRDLIDTPHLFDDKDRLPGHDGTPGMGLKMGEAIPLVELWWEKNRMRMPDFNKTNDNITVNSLVLRGFPWFNLDKQSKLRVLAHWYAHVGIHTVILGKTTSQDEIKGKTTGEVRDDGEKVFDVLRTDGTHGETKTENGISEAATLVNEQGVKLTTE